MPVEVTDAANFLVLDAQFTSDPGAEGLLGVYWDGEPIGLLDERFLLPSTSQYHFLLPGTILSGDYELGFRLDPYTDTPSSVSVGNIRLGFAESVIVPEPTSLILLLIGTLAVRRRGQRPR